MSGTRHRKRKIFSSDLGSAEGYCICLGAKGKYSLSVYTVARTSPFGVSSVALVNIDKDATREAMNKPGNRRQSPADLRGVRKSLHRLEPGRQIVAAQTFQPETAVVLRCPRACWKELSTESKGGITTCSTLLGYSGASVLPRHLDSLKNVSPVRLYVRVGFRCRFRW